MSISSPSFSIRFPPAQPPDILGRSARRAEEAGFDGIWMVDTPMIGDGMFDPYVDLTDLPDPLVEIFGREIIPYFRR